MQLLLVQTVAHSLVAEAREYFCRSVWCVHIYQREKHLPCWVVGPTVCAVGRSKPVEHYTSLVFSIPRQTPMHSRFGEEDDVAWVGDGLVYMLRHCFP